MGDRGGIAAFTKLLAPGALFGITPCTEAVAMRVARQHRSRPVQILDLPVAPALTHAGGLDGDDDEDVDYDYDE